MRTLPGLLLVLGLAVLARAQNAEDATPAKPKAPVARVPLVEPGAPGTPAATSPRPAKTAAVPGAKKETAPKASAAKDAAQKDTAKKGTKKEDEIGKIEGIEIARSGNRFLGVQIVGGNFKLNFYDAKKKPVAPDVSRAVLRWDPKYKLGMERVVLMPGGGPNALTGEKFVRPPYNFKLTIVLLGEDANAADGAEPAGETHVIDFRQ